MLWEDSLNDLRPAITSRIGEVSKVVLLDIKPLR